MGLHFAMIGAGGYIAPRHMQAIKETGNHLTAATDPSDSVGILDQYFDEVPFFTEIERFDRHLEKLRIGQMAGKPIDYVTVCSPNYLHDAHIRLGMRLGAHVICEKPLVINPWNLDQLEQLEKEYGKDIYCILQLRLLESLKSLKAQVTSENKTERYAVELSYVTRRGPWYFVSWKGDEAKSGGIVMNIGVHFFDLLIWIFGKVQGVEVHHRSAERCSGSLVLEKADVSWFMSVDKNDLPPECVKKDKPAYRSITVDGKKIEFSSGFTDLHTLSYKEVLEGRGFRVGDCRDSIDLVYKVRTADVVSKKTNQHPFLE